MIEHRDDDLSGCIAYLLALAILIVAIILLLNRLDRQENWIRDLQRRIAVIEGRK